MTTTNAIAIGPVLLVSENEKVWAAASKNWHGLTPMGLQEPAPLFNITHQTHVEDIKLSGGS
jgi:hypothetical protein